MRTLAGLVLIAAAASAQPGPPPAPKKEVPAAQRERAMQLFQEASDAAPGYKPEVAAAALMHLAANYLLSDKPKAKELAELAFASTQGMPLGGDRLALQAEAVKYASKADPALGEQLLRRMDPPDPSAEQDPRQAAAQTLVSGWLEQGNLAALLDLIAFLHQSGPYPYGIAGDLLKKLDPADDRNVAILAAAASAFASKPKGPFPELLGRYHDRMPQTMLDGAVRSIVNAIVDRKDEETYQETVSTAKGTATFGSRQDAELFHLLHLLEKVDPKRAQEVLNQRPALKAMLARFPRGVQSMQEEGNENLSRSISVGGPGESMNESGRMQLFALSDSLAMKSQQAAAKGEFGEAERLAESIPVPMIRAGVFASMAERIARNDPARGKPALDKALAMTEKIEQPQERLMVMDRLIPAAVRTGNKELALKLMKEAVTAADGLLKEDTNSESPNLALREFWPSTQAYRRVVHTAGTEYGVEGESILLLIRDPDSQLLAKIEFAQSLIGQPRTSGQVWINRPDRSSTRDTN